MLKSLKEDEVIRRLKDSAFLTESPRAKMSLTLSPSHKVRRKQERWDALSQAIQSITKCVSQKDIIRKLPKVIQGLIDYDRLSLIFPDSVFYKALNVGEGLPSEGGLAGERAFHGGVWVKVVSAAGCPCSAPAFNSLAELLVGRRK